MRKYIRLYTLLHLLATALVVAALGAYFHLQAGRSIAALGEQANLSAARYFNSAIWAGQGAALQAGTPAAALPDDMQRFMRSTGMVASRIYSTQGALLYTSGGTLALADFNRLAEAVRNSPNHAASELAFPALENLQTAASPLTRTLIAFGAPGHEIFVEFFSDATHGWKSMQFLQWAVCAAVTLASLLALIGAYMVYYRADYLIAAQYERNVELEGIASSAEEAAKQKTQFLAGISHELRTPLNAIIGFSDLLKTEMADEVKNPKLSNYINDIHQSGVHLLSLINDILDFSKAEAGKLELEVGEVNATKTAAGSIRLVLPRAEVARVALVNQMPKENFVLETDGKKLKQILLNLLSNAVKFTPEGGTVKLLGWQDLADDIFVFQVSDTGIGIEQKDIAKAMAPFGQVDNALSRKYEGSGLGLPLTRKFVELMGGKFSIQSEQGKGTTITFSLPRVFKPTDGVVVKKA